jgi:hypothetical protein
MINAIWGRYPALQYFDLLDLPAWGPIVDSSANDNEGDVTPLPIPPDDLEDIEEEEEEGEEPTPLPTPDGEDDSSLPDVPDEEEQFEKPEPIPEPGECKYELGRLIEALANAPADACDIVSQVFDSCPEDALRNPEMFKMMQYLAARVLQEYDISRELVMWGASLAVTLAACEASLSENKAANNYAREMLSSTPSMTDLACFATVIARTEGAMQTTGYNVIRNSGAYGYFQLLPHIGRAHGEDIGVAWNVPKVSSNPATVKCGPVLCLAEAPISLCEQSMVNGRYLAGVARVIADRFWRNGKWHPVNEGAVARFQAAVDALKKNGYPLTNPNILWLLMRTYWATGWGYIDKDHPSALERWVDVVNKYCNRGSRDVLKLMSRCYNLSKADIPDYVPEPLPEPEPGPEPTPEPEPDEEEDVEEEEQQDEADSEEGDVHGDITPNPTPGAFYQIKYGDTLLGVVGSAYGVGAGGTRLSLAKKVNAWSTNKRFWIPPKSTFGKKYFPGGIISFYPQFSESYESQYSGDTAGSGSSYAYIYIPSKSEIA